MSSMSSRGVLWEVIRPVLAWPLRSPLRLGFVCTAVLIALVVAWWLLVWPAQQDAESGISTDERIARVEAGQQQSRQAVEALQTQQAAWQDQMLAEMDSRLSQGSQRDAGQRARIQASLDSLTSTQVSLAQRIAQMEQRLPCHH